jgi:cellulose 1,4-beta-cellobiosidase
LIKLKWNAVSGATSYNLKRGTANNGPYPTVYSGLVVTNYSDATVTNAVTYYYVVTAVSGVESANSLQASAAPLPSSMPTNIMVQVAGGQLQLSWPPDHLGWRLQIQTNDLSKGLGTNWVTVPNSTNVCQTNVTVNPTNGSVFLRMVYP